MAIAANLKSVESIAESAESSSGPPVTGNSNEVSMEAPIATANGASSESPETLKVTSLMFLCNKRKASK